MIKSDETALATKYKVTSYPSFFILKHGEKAPIKYDGDTFTYKMLFEFINIYLIIEVRVDTDPNVAEIFLTDV